MNNVTLSEIANIVASKVDISKEETEAFVHQLIEIIFDSLTIDESISINNFGTFKLTKVQTNVNDGSDKNQEFRSEYNVSFTPDPVLSNLVNKPFAQFEKTLLVEGIDLDLPIHTEIDGDFELLEKEDLVINDQQLIITEVKDKSTDKKELDIEKQVQQNFEANSNDNKKLPKWPIIVGAAAVIGIFTYLLFDDSSD